MEDGRDGLQNKKETTKRKAIFCLLFHGECWRQFLGEKLIVSYLEIKYLLLQNTLQIFYVQWEHLWLKMGYFKMVDVIVFKLQLVCPI